MTNALIVVVSALAVLAALGLGGYAVALRRGRTPERRAWALGSEESARTTILILPGGAAMLGAVGFLGLTRVTDAVAPLVGICFLLGAVPVLWAGLHLPVPLAFYPAWAREQRTLVRARQRTSRRGQKA